MTRQAALYIKRRDVLHARLGGHCAVCGTRELLSVDHENGRAWEPSKVSSHERVKRYVMELLAGVKLRLLCRECNGRDGQRRRQPSRATS